SLLEDRPQEARVHAVEVDDEDLVRRSELDQAEAVGARVQPGGLGVQPNRRGGQKLRQSGRQLRRAGDEVNWAPIGQRRGDTVSTVSAPGRTVSNGTSIVSNGTSTV